MTAQLRCYTVLVRTEEGKRFELEFLARAAADAVKRASRWVTREGYTVRYAVWLGVISQAEWLARGER